MAKKNNWVLAIIALILVIAFYQYSIGFTILADTPYQVSYTYGDYEVQCYSTYDFGDFPKNSEGGCTTSTLDRNVVSGLSILTSGSATASGCGLVAYSGKQTYCMINNLEIDSERLESLRIVGSSLLSPSGDKVELFLYDGVTSSYLYVQEGSSGGSFDIYIFKGQTGSLYMSNTGADNQPITLNGKYKIGYYTKLGDMPGGQNSVSGSSQITISNIILNQTVILNKMTVYRLQNNVCNNISIYESELQSNDYLTLNDCQSNIQVTINNSSNVTNVSECPTGQTKCSDGICKASCAVTPTTTGTTTTTTPTCGEGLTLCSDGSCKVSCAVEKPKDYSMYYIIGGVVILAIIGYLIYRRKR